jgi:hypothetical protein
MGENELRIALVLAACGLLVLAFNSFLAAGISSKLETQGAFLSSLRLAEAPRSSAELQQGEESGSGSDIEALMAELIPRGVPDVYGEELGVSFEEPVSSLDILAALDGDLYPDGKIKFSDLSGENQQRYINIAGRISCEYCCGAKSIAFSDGRVACGCAHSAAMRGLAMYLLQNHGGEFTDAQVLEELTKWKTLFFPKQTVQKALQLRAQGSALNATSLNELPDMVGGC